MEKGRGYLWILGIAAAGVVMLFVVACSRDQRGSAEVSATPAEDLEAFLTDVAAHAAERERVTTQVNSLSAKLAAQARGSEQYCTTLGELRKLTTYSLRGLDEAGVELVAAGRVLGQEVAHMEASFEEAYYSIASTDTDIERAQRDACGVDPLEAIKAATN